MRRADQRRQQSPSCNACHKPLPHEGAELTLARFGGAVSGMSPPAGLRDPAGPHHAAPGTPVRKETEQASCERIRCRDGVALLCRYVETTCVLRQLAAYSMTSSARASSVSGTVSPSALAVFRLITSSYLVGACTGSSAGFVPLRMRST